MSSLANGCVKKKPYKFRQDAERKLVERDDKTGKVYSCKWCGYWHIGHDKNDSQRKMGSGQENRK